MTKEEYNVGIYCRLSNDDEKDGESTSIENQKLILRRYVQDCGWNEVDIYVDDGYSGTNFERPGVQRLLADVQAKRINVVLVKDLSRFGRNYIEFGWYIDYMFQRIGCRFIALNNGIDTGRQDGSTDMMGILNLFNEFHSRDTSRKVRAVLKSCAEAGMFMGSCPPYGYKRDPKDRHHLLIDEETAPVVQRIFLMRAKGMGYLPISKQLNMEGILSPGMLSYQRKEFASPRSLNHFWQDQTVRHILQNEVYIGNMVQCKRSTVSFKDKKSVQRRPDEWVRVEGTHEPIVSRELWEAAASVSQRRIQKRTQSNGKTSIFSGLVRCGSCGCKMRAQTRHWNRKDGTVGQCSIFVCASYSKSGKIACTPHIIQEEALEQVVLTDVRAKAQLAQCSREQLTGQILRIQYAERNSLLASYEQEQHSVKARVDELDRLMQELYEDKCGGVISGDVFRRLMNQYEKERAEKAAVLPELARKCREQLEARQDADHWADMIRRYTEIDKLDETVLLELVDHIVVGTPYMADGKRTCDVQIFYRYVGNVDEALSQEERR